MSTLTKGERDRWWWARFVRDFGIHDKRTLNRPSPIPWKEHYLDHISFNEKQGISFSNEAINTANEVTCDFQTDLQKLALKGESTPFVELFRKEKSKKSLSLIEKENKSLLHYAVLTRNYSFLCIFLEEWTEVDVNRKDIITGFTPLHFAIFVQSKEIFIELLKRGADIRVKDNFFAEALDYARMLGIGPMYPHDMMPLYIQVYDQGTHTISNMAIEEWEKLVGVTFMPYITCTNEYIIELMFTGFCIGVVDEEARANYQNIIWGCDPTPQADRKEWSLDCTTIMSEMEGETHSTGDDTLIMAWINEQVGYGCYVAHDIQKGDFLVRYGGCLRGEHLVENRDYCVMSGVEGVVLDARHSRNMGAMINHSSSPNARLECFFHRGAEQAMIIALRDIKKGEQVLLDYSDMMSVPPPSEEGEGEGEDDMFFTESTLDTSHFVDMKEFIETPGGFPLTIELT